jgi:hypothetical protein
MPFYLGSWEGENGAPIDPKLLALIGADVIVDRKYQNPDHDVILSHRALFSDWEVGFHHDPMKVYREAGWRLDNRIIETIPINDIKNIHVSMSRWEKDRDKILVLNWYQIDEKIILRYSELKKLANQNPDKKLVPRLSRCNSREIC